MFCAAASEYITVLPEASVPNVGFVVLLMVSVPLFITLMVPVTLSPVGIVKLMVCVPSPTCITEPVPLTVHAAAIVGAVLFTIIKVLPAVVKFVGAVPVPFVLVPHVPTTFKLPVD